MPKLVPLAFLALVVLTATAQHSTLIARAPVHPVQWAPCHGAFECAVVPVPLDY